MLPAALLRIAGQYSKRRPRHIPRGDIHSDTRDGQFTVIDVCTVDITRLPYEIVSENKENRVDRIKSDKN